MKSIYKVLIIVILYLLSSKTYAQFEQSITQNDRASVERSGSIFDCYCRYEEDFDRLNVALAGLEADRRQRWLEEQETILKNEIERRTRKEYSSFNEAQQDYFKSRKADRTFKVMNNRVKNRNEREKKVLDRELKGKYSEWRLGNGRLFELNNGDSRPEKYGTLKWKGRSLKNMTLANSEDFLKSGMDNSRADLLNIKKDLIDIKQIYQGMALGKESMIAKMVAEYIDHYRSYSFPNRIRLMTGYLIMENASILRTWPWELGIYGITPYTSHNTWTDTDYFIDVALGYVTNPVSVSDPTFTNYEQAIRHFAINIFSDDIVDLIINDPDIYQAVGDYLHTNQYPQNIINITNQLFRDYINQGRYEVDIREYASFGAPEIIQYEHPHRQDHDLALAWRADSENGHKYRGFGNVLSALFNDHTFTPFEGRIIRQMFTANNIDILDEISDEDLGRLFRFRQTDLDPPTDRDNYRITIEFENNLGVEFRRRNVFLEYLLSFPPLMKPAISLLEGNEVNFENIITEYTFGLLDNAVSQFINDSSNVDFKAAVEKYILFNRYLSDGAVSYLNNFFQSFINGTDLSIDAGLYLGRDGYSQFQNEYFKDLVVHFPHSDEAMQQGLVDTDALYSVLSTRNTDRTNSFMGGIIRNIFAENGFLISSDVNSLLLGQIFRIRDAGYHFYPAPPRFGRYSESTYIFFRVGNSPQLTPIGTTLWDSGITLQNLFDSAFNLEAALALANGEDFDIPFRRMVYDLKTNLNLNDAQEDWLIGNKPSAELLNTFVQENLINDEVPTNVNLLANEIANFGVQNGDNNLAQQLVNDMLTAVNSNSTFDIAPFIQNEQFVETGFTVDGSCCPNDPFIMNDPLYGRELGIDLVNATIDGFANLMIAFIDYGVGDRSEGQIIRKLLVNMGVEVGSDIDDATLGELYQLRKRDRTLVVEYQAGFVANLIDLGFATLDVMVILSPSRGGGAYLAVNGGGRITAAAMRAHLAKLKDIAQTTLAGGRGYRSFDAFKRVEGNASSGNALHHIVEQGGHKSLNQQKFGKTNIHNTKNILDIPDGAGQLHRRITGYYNSIDAAIHPTKKVREAIEAWSFQEQYEFGIRKLKEFGWDGITGIID